MNLVLTLAVKGRVSDEFKGVLSQVRPNGMPDAPIFRIDIDFEKVRSLGLNIADVNNTLSTAWGGTYVNDFVDRGRVKRVYVQADAPARMLPEDLEKWYVRNNQGEMVPFTAFASTHWDFGSPQLSIWELSDLEYFTHVLVDF